MKTVPIICSIIIIIANYSEYAHAQVEPNGFSRLKYNHPGLVVDLGVGLWGQALPMDYDGDGQVDILVGWGRRPPGINLYTRVGDGPKAIEFDAGVRISDYKRRMQTAYSNGNWWVTSADGELYPNFTESGIQDALPLPYKPEFGGTIHHWRYSDYDADGTPDLMINVRVDTGSGSSVYNDQGVWQAPERATTLYWVRNTGTALEPVFGHAEQVMVGNDPLIVHGDEPNFMDFDGDGLPDLIFTHGVDALIFFKNIGHEGEPRFSEGKRLIHEGEVIHMDLEMLSPAGADYDGDGDVDLVVGEEDGRVSLLENTGETVGGVPAFKPPVFLRQLADELKYGVLPTPCGYDFDADGDTDLVAGNTAGYIGFIENLGGSPPRWAEPVNIKADGKVIRILAGENGSIQGPAEAKWGYTTVSVVDWDLDGLPDLIANSVWGKVVWFRNIGTLTDPRFTDEGMVEVEWEGAAPTPPWTWWKPKEKELAPQWRTSIQGVDLTEDGLPDLVAVDYDGYLVMHERVRIDGQFKLLPGKRIFHMEKGQSNVFEHNQKPYKDTNGDGKNDYAGPDVNGRLGYRVGRTGIRWIDRSGDPRYQAPDIDTALRMTSGWAGRSGRVKFVLTDWDHDGRLDLIANSSNANFLRNVSDEPGKFVFRDMGPMDELVLAGHTTSPALIDINGDGIEDLVLGAEDGFFYYLPNTYKE